MSATMVVRSTPRRSGRLLLGFGLARVQEQQDRELTVADAERRQRLRMQIGKLELRPFEQTREPTAQQRPEVLVVGHAARLLLRHRSSASLTIRQGIKDVPSILLTGATGLVGSRLLPRLAEAGFACRALVRRDIDPLPNVTPVGGDLSDPDALRPAVEGVDAVVHLAALFRTDDEDAIWRANLDGTQHLRNSTLTGSILRLPFVYGDGDGHLAMIANLAPRFGLHPAHTYSVAHHRDVMTAVAIALSGAMDGRIVNIADDAPVTVLEMAALAGDPLEGSAEPLANPWAGRMDIARARELGFRPTVPSMYEAAREGIL